MCAIETRPYLGTDRLTLREPQTQDVSAIAGLANDAGVAGMLSTMPHPYGVADAHAWVTRERALPEFAIAHRDFGLMGCIGFSEKSPRRLEVGYWLGRPFWGRGYATEALDATLRWVRDAWKKKAVWAGHFADNTASGQVLVKTGFLYTGDVELRESAAREAPAPTRMMVWLA